MKKIHAELPPAFIQRLQGIIPADDWSTTVASFALVKDPCWRVNTLKADPHTVLALLAADSITAYPIPRLANSYYTAAIQRSALTHHQLVTQGHLYLQNLSSQLPPLLLNPQPDTQVLDLTAAPGSKTSQLAALMGNSGTIAAVEAVKDRFFRLQANLKSLGVTNTKFYLKDGRRVGQLCPLRFDAVLLDAPCSAEARFMLHEPNSYAYWSLNKIKQCARKQWQLLDSAWRSLKIGGTLVYSTCSFAPEENESIVAKLLSTYPDASLVNVELPLTNVQRGLTQWENTQYPASMSNCIRLLPNQWCDGFFIAKFIKSEMI